MTIKIIDKAKTVKCQNCGTSVKSSPTGTAKCPKCGSAVKNPAKAGFKNQDGHNKVESGKARHNGPAGGGFFPSKKPKGPPTGGGSNAPKDKKTGSAGEMTAAEKKIYQQAYNKVFSTTKDKAKADKAGKAAVKAARSAASGNAGGGAGGGSKNPFKKSEFTIEATIAKTHDDLMQAFGWAYMSEKNGQPVADHSGEWAPIEEVEKGAYRYNLVSRDAGEMHVSKGVGQLIESVVFTEEKYLAMGFPAEVAKVLPKGWWIGYQVSDPNVWGMVKSGQYPMLSIHGKAVRKEINPAGSSVEAPGAELVLAAKMEIAAAEAYEDLSKGARGYLRLQGEALRNDRMSKGIGPKPHGPSVKCPDIYEALKREGKTKTQAAKISNECFSSGDCNCH